MIRNSIAVFGLFFFVSLANIAGGQTSDLAVLLTQERAGMLKLDTLVPVLAVNDRGNIVVGTDNNLFALNNRQFLLKVPVSISDCAFTPDGALLLVSGKSLGYCAGGYFFSQATLPENGMRLAVGSNRLYVFGGDNDKATAIYVVEPGRGHAKLCDMPLPVACAATAGGTLYFAVAGDIYRLVPGEELNLICRMPGPVITSMAASGSGEVYFTAGLTLYLWQNGRVAIVGEGLGDKVCWQNGALYILNSEKKSLIRLRNTEFVMQEE